MADFLGGSAGACIQQTNAAEGKSPACEDRAVQGQRARGWINPAQEKTRPSAQYTANDLASPGY
jgi:hypothetical protein